MKLIVVVLLASCGTDAGEVQPGTERAPCQAGACNSGLVCLSDRCVRPPPPAPADQRNKGLPAECSRYLIALERYTTCRGLPPEARQSIAKTVAEMRKNWSVFTTSTPMPPAVTAACKQGNDAIAQAMVSFHCGP